MPTFELDIGEQMCQAKVFVCEFTAEDFEEVPHIPSCSIHIIMNFSLANIRWFFMDHYFLNNESHACKKMAAIIIVIFICTFTYHFYTQHSGLDFFKKNKLLQGVSENIYYMLLLPISEIEIFECVSEVALFFKMF